MTYISIDLLTYRADDFRVSSQLFGFDVTGFRSNNAHFFEISDQLGSDFIRWPGQLIADSISSAYSEENYDLANPFVMDRGSKDNLQDILEDIAQWNQGLVMLAPTERFITFHSGSHSFTVDVEAARHSVHDFLITLAEGDRFGAGVQYDLPEDFIIQLGQEYYTTSFGSHFDESLPPAVAEQLWTSYISAISTIYGEMATEIEETNLFINNHPELFEHWDINVEVAVQMGRFQSVESALHPFVGSSNDVSLLIQDMGQSGLDAVDYLLWQRYIPRTESIINGYSVTSSGLTLEDTVAIWEEAAGHDFKTLVGTSVASLTRKEALSFYNGSVASSAFDFSVRSDKNFEEYYQRRLAATPGGEEMPATVVELFAELVGAKVDRATAFTGDLVSADAQSGRLSAMYYENISDAGQNVLLAGGEMYAELSRSLVGMSIVSGAGEVSVSENDVNINIFRDEDTIIIYASSTELNAGPKSVTVDLTGLEAPFESIVAQSFTTQIFDDWQYHFDIVNLEDRWTNFDQSAEAAIYSKLMSSDLGVVYDGGNQVTFQLNQSWEVASVRIELGEIGTNADDLLKGWRNDDVLQGLAGNDQIRGGSGNDRLFGGEGDDTLWGGDGADLICGGNGNDTVSYTTSEGGVRASLNDASLNDGDALGDEICEVENLVGSRFNDVIYGSQGSNVLFGYNGNDRIQGRAGDDLIHGQRGSDRLFGEGGADTLFGGSGEDKLDGGSGNDLLFGGHGDDLIFGGDGSDEIYGGLGSDTLYGGLGADNFVFDMRDVVRGEPDLIADFEVGEDSIIFNFGADFDEQDLAFGTDPTGEFLSISFEGGSKTILVDANCDLITFLNSPSLFFGLS